MSKCCIVYNLYNKLSVRKIDECVAEQTKLFGFKKCYSGGYTLDQGILKGEVSLYSWPPVWLVWISLFLKIKTKIVSSHTTDSKPVKQEVNGTVILPPLVFPDWTIVYSLSNQESEFFSNCQNQYRNDHRQAQNHQ